jgi:hypothetical protein
MLRVYFDLCALKRPWDDQRQLRASQETEVVAGLIRLVQLGRITALRSPIHDEENLRNSDKDRAAAIASWFEAIPAPTSAASGIPERGARLFALGFGPFDALHLSWAEGLKADLLVTTDDRFVKRARRPIVECTVPVVLPAVAWTRVSG